MSSADVDSQATEASPGDEGATPPGDAGEAPPGDEGEAPPGDEDEAPPGDEGEVDADPVVNAVPMRRAYGQCALVTPRVSTPHKACTLSIVRQNGHNHHLYKCIAVDPEWDGEISFFRVCVSNGRTFGGEGQRSTGYNIILCECKKLFTVCVGAHAFHVAPITCWSRVESHADSSSAQ